MGIEILNAECPSSHSNSKTEKQEIQIISEKNLHLQLFAFCAKSSVQPTQVKRKITPGEISRKTYFLGTDVQRQKIGSITKKLYFYKNLTCFECDRTFRTRFGLDMHFETIHPKGLENFDQMDEYEEIDCTELSDDD